MKKLYIRALCYFFILIPLLIFGQEQWSLSKNNQGIKIWVRNYKDSSYKEYKATMRIKTSMNVVVNELLQAPVYMKDNEEGVSHLVKVAADGTYIFYVKNDFPWPIKDRDVVSRLRVHEISEDKVKLVIDAVPNELPKLKNTLRIKELSGYWLLEEEQEGVVTITQQLYINPEGALPPFITNSLLVIGPFKTFLNLKIELENTNS